MFVFNFFIDVGIIDNSVSKVTVQRVGSERLLLVFVPVKPRPRFPMSFVMVFFFMSNELAVKDYCLFLFL
jgi:hypothetical protein